MATTKETGEMTLINCYISKTLENQWLEPDGKKTDLTCSDVSTLSLKKVRITKNCILDGITASLLTLIGSSPETESEAPLYATFFVKKNQYKIRLLHYPSNMDDSVCFDLEQSCVLKNELVYNHRRVRLVYKFIVG